MTGDELTIRRDGVTIAVTDLGGEGRPLVLLHGLAGSSRELLPTAEALTDSFRVLLMDQRGHGRSTRRPDDLSRQAFVDDVVAVLEEVVPGQPCVLVGQSMGAHTAFLTAAARPNLIERLVMLEGHVAGSDDAAEAAALGRFVADLESTPEGLAPRFDADVMERLIEAVHEPRWEEWEALRVPTLAVFAKDGMFGDAHKDDLIRRRPATDRIDLSVGSHDAHLDAFDEWISALRRWPLAETEAAIAR